MQTRPVPGLPSGPTGRGNDSSNAGVLGRPLGVIVKSNKPGAGMPGAGKPYGDQNGADELEGNVLHGVYRPTQRTVINFQATDSSTREKVILEEPPYRRVYLSISAPYANLGSVLVNFGSQVVKLAESEWVLEPGANIMFPFFVPQSRVFACYAPTALQIVAAGTAILNVAWSDVDK